MFSSCRRPSSIRGRAVTLSKTISINRIFGTSAQPKYLKQLRECSNDEGNSDSIVSGRVIQSYKMMQSEERRCYLEAVQDQIKEKHNRLGNTGRALEVLSLLYRALR